MDASRKLGGLFLEDQMVPHAMIILKNTTGKIFAHSEQILWKEEKMQPPTQYTLNYLRWIEHTAITIDKAVCLHIEKGIFYFIFKSSFI